MLFPKKTIIKNNVLINSINFIFEINLINH